MSDPKAGTTHLIIGAGVFGASTALRLATTTRFNVVLVDSESFPGHKGASWDRNKVIRADYTDILYMEMALEAKKVWENDPLFQPFYHESGMFWISSAEFASTVADNYKRLRAEPDFEIVDPTEAKQRYNGLFAEANYAGDSKVLINRSCGWADATNALQAVIEAAIAAGVQYVKADIVRLEFGDGGSCIGATSASGEFLSAQKIVLCTGAGTARLIADSAPDRDDIQVGDRLIASATCIGIAKLSPTDAEKFKSSPVCCQDVPPGQGGSIPPNRENELKFWQDVQFKNTVRHSSGAMISVRPSGLDYNEWDAPEGMKREIDLAKAAVYGRAGKELSISEYKVCWDAITPTEDFLICPHPRCSNLFVATGGSSHGWKFLPVLGRYVTEMLHGELDPKMAERWAWDHHLKNRESCTDVWPRLEIRDAVL